MTTTRIPQEGAVVVGTGAPKVRISQAGGVVIGVGASKVRIVQTGVILITRILRDVSTESAAAPAVASDAGLGLGHSSAPALASAQDAGLGLGALSADATAVASGAGLGLGSFPIFVESTVNDAELVFGTTHDGAFDSAMGAVVAGQSQMLQVGEPELWLIMPGPTNAQGEIVLQTPACRDTQGELTLRVPTPAEVVLTLPGSNSSELTLIYQWGTLP